MIPKVSKSNNDFNIKNIIIKIILLLINLLNFFYIKKNIHCLVAEVKNIIILMIYNI